MFVEKYLEVPLTKLEADDGRKTIPFQKALDVRVMTDQENMSLIWVGWSQIKDNLMADFLEDMWSSFG